MKPVSPQLLALLQQPADLALLEVDTFEFALTNAALGVLRYVDGPLDVVLNGRTYAAAGTTGPFFNRDGKEGRVHLKTGLDVDTMVFDVAPGSATVNGIPFLIACSIGLFESADVKLQRLFMPTYGDTRRGPLPLFAGTVAEIDVGRTAATFHVDSHLERLNQSFPRNVYQAGCVNSLGDASCLVNLPPLAVALTALGGTTAGVLSANFTAAPAGRFDQGKVLFTSGGNAGLALSVKTAVAGTPGTITMLAPFPLTPSPGDTFQLFPGCNKSFTDANGCPKFGNQARFRGFDLIPAPETAV